MGIDSADHLGAVERSVSSSERAGKAASAVILTRNYETTVDDLWDAVTNGERIPRWFLPIAGELKLGGRYQLEGNAGGEITQCEPPTYLAVTWEFGGDTSWVEIRLSKVDDRHTSLTLRHTANVSDFGTQYGPGATGVGWEMGLLGLALHLAQPDAPKMDESAFSASPEGKAFVTGSSEAWGRASIAAGTDPAEANEAAGRTTAFYTGEASESP